MPRGIPKAGTRAPGAGRPKNTVPKKMARVRVDIADKLDDLLLFLHELNDEITLWEEEINGKDLAKNPRYSKAKVLATSIRERINALGMNFNDSNVDE